MLDALKKSEPMSEHSPTYQPPPDNGLDIRYIDDDLLVVDKPAGLLSVPGRGPGKQDCLSARVQARYLEALPVHRLDLGTSGLVVLARNPAIHRALNRLFETRRVEKCYVALVAGHMAAGERVIDLPLIADWPNRPCQMVDHAVGKPSRTRLRVVGYDAGLDATRVDLFPETGRSHQLRVHLQAQPSCGWRARRHSDLALSCPTREVCDAACMNRHTRAVRNYRASRVCQMRRM